MEERSIVVFRTRLIVMEHVLEQKKIADVIVVSLSRFLSPDVPVVISIVPSYLRAAEILQPFI